MQFTYSRNWKFTTHPVAAQTVHNKNSKIKRETFPFKRCHDPKDTHLRVKLDVKYNDHVCIGMRMRWGVDGNGFSAISRSSLSNTLFSCVFGGTLLAEMAYGTVWEGLIRGERRPGGLSHDTTEEGVWESVVSCWKGALLARLKLWSDKVRRERKRDPDNKQKYGSLTDWVTHTADQRKHRWWERRCDKTKEFKNLKTHYIFPQTLIFFPNNYLFLKQNYFET